MSPYRTNLNYRCQSSPKQEMRNGVIGAGSIWQWHHQQYHDMTQESSFVKDHGLNVSKPMISIKEVKLFKIKLNYIVK